MSDYRTDGMQYTGKSASGEQIYSEYGSTNYYKKDVLGDLQKCDSYGNEINDYDDASSSYSYQPSEAQSYGNAIVFIVVAFIGLMLMLIDSFAYVLAEIDRIHLLNHTVNIYLLYIASTLLYHKYLTKFLNKKLNRFILSIPMIVLGFLFGYVWLHNLYFLSYMRTNGIGRVLEALMFAARFILPLILAKKALRNKYTAYFYASLGLSHYISHYIISAVWIRLFGIGLRVSVLRICIPYVISLVIVHTILSKIREEKAIKNKPRIT